MDAKRRLRQDELLAKYGHPQSIGARRAMVRLSMPRGQELTLLTIATQAHRSIASKFVDEYVATCRLLDEWPTEIQGLNVRKIAGSDNWSLHAWALAWDIFDATSSRIDPHTGRGIPSVAWFNEMQRRGFFAGQNFRKPDLHHLEWPW